MIKQKLKSIGLTKRILVILLAVGMSLCLIPAIPAQASTDSVEIYVGYFGSTYVKLADVSEAEMEGLECGEYTYSSIDAGGFTRYNLAYGVLLTSLLDYVGIKSSDVDEIYFRGTDDKISRGFYNLVSNVHRYYYPYLAENYNREDPSASNVERIMALYEEVPAILAFQQSLARDTGAFDYDKYKAGMSATQCLRIVFGQTNWAEADTTDSVYWVYQITVRLAGNPIKTENMEMEYGSDAALQYDVDSGYEGLNEMIQNGLKIWSDTPGIVTLDEEGNLHAVSSGTGRIMFEYEDEEGTFSQTMFVTVGPEPQGDPGGDGGGGTTEGGDPGGGDTGDTGGSELAPPPGDEDEDSYTEQTGSGEQEQTPETEQPQEEQPSQEQEQKPSDGSGTGGDTGFGGDGSGAGDEDGNNNGDAGSGTGTVTPGTGSGGSLPSSDEGSYEEEGGTEGDALGRGDSTSTESGDADRIWEGMDAAGELVPLSGEGEAVYEQVQGYMEELLEQMEEVPSTAEITSLTEQVRQYIEELIEQMEEEDEPLDIDEIIEMVEEYIEELVEEEEETAAAAAEAEEVLEDDASEEVIAEEDLSEDDVSEDNASKDSEAAEAVYLSLGNISGGGSTNGGSVAGGGTSGGSGGKMLQIEETPFYYYVILIVVLAALFVAGGAYRSLRFRKETTR